MTPQQRARDVMNDHETTLLEMADRIAHVIRQKASAHTGQVADGDLKLAASHAACLAGADALRRGTCGTCKFWEQTWPGINPTRGRCENHQAPACDSETVADDGCIKGYVPTEPTR